MGAKNKSIFKPVVIAVEGLDYLHLLLSQLDGRPEFDEVQLVDCFEADADLKGNLEILLKSSAFQRKQVRALGVIRDAEHDHRAVGNSLHSSLNAVGVPVPSSPIWLLKEDVLTSGICSSRTTGHRAASKMRALMHRCYRVNTWHARSGFSNAFHSTFLTTTPIGEPR